MAIKEHVARGSKVDEISQVIGSDAYYMRYYFKELRERCLGAHSKGLVGVSRYYPMEDKIVEEGQSPPLPVIVDFEPRKGEDLMFLEEKRKFFMEKKIIYVPVFLTEILDKEQFAARVAEEKQRLARGYREEMEDASLETVDIPMFSDETIMAEVDALALERVRLLGLRGAAKNKRLKREKEAILKERLDGLADSRRRGAVPAPVG